jgi:hypothetical protein
VQVKLRRPGCQILLKKNIKRQVVATSGASGGATSNPGSATAQRQGSAGTTGTSITMSSRYSGAGNVIDMTQYLGEGSVIHTRKSVREGAGSFSVTFQDSIDKATMDSVYSSIEPMDSLEFYFSGDSYKSAGSPLPLIMRGIVSSIRRRQAMSADGKPVMQVTITGQDYGKILGMYQVFFLPDSGQAALLTSFPFFSTYGTNFNVQSGKTFVQTAIQNVLNPFIQSMSTFSPNTITAAQQQLAQLQQQADNLSDQVAAVTVQAQAAGAASTQFNLSGQVPGAFTLPLNLQQQNSQPFTTQLQALGQQQVQVQAQITALQAWIKANSNQQTAPLMPIGTDIQIGPEVVSVAAGAWTGGTLMSLFKTYCDIGPWNELYVEDRADAPYLVYRPVPFLDAATGQPIIPANYTGSVVAPSTGGGSSGGSGAPASFGSASSSNGSAPATTTITRSDVVSIDTGRSDENVGNYFWVDAPRFNLNYGPLSQQMALYAQQQGGNPLVTQAPNCNPSLYAIRKMEASTQMGAPTEKNSGNGVTGEQQINGKGDFMGWIIQRLNQLRALNVDNVVWESGSIFMKGNENIRAGTFVDIADDSGDLPSQYYAHAVEHTYEVFGNFFSTVEFDRGTNFIDRVSSTGSSAPYLTEQFIKPRNTSALSPSGTPGLTATNINPRDID